MDAPEAPDLEDNLSQALEYRNSLRRSLFEEEDDVTGDSLAPGDLGGHGGLGMHVGLGGRGGTASLVGRGERPDLGGLAGRDGTNLGLGAPSGHSATPGLGASGVRGATPSLVVRGGSPGVAILGGHGRSSGLGGSSVSPGLGAPGGRGSSPGWNEALGTMVATDDYWEHTTKGHSLWKQLRKGPPDHEVLLQKMFGGVVVDGFGVVYLVKILDMGTMTGMWEEGLKKDFWVQMDNDGTNDEEDMSVTIARGCVGALRTFGVVTIAFESKYQQSNMSLQPLNDCSEGRERNSFFVVSCEPSEDTTIILGLTIHLSFQENNTGNKCPSKCFFFLLLSSLGTGYGYSDTSYIYAIYVRFLVSVEVAAVLCHFLWRRNGSLLLLSSASAPFLSCNLSVPPCAILGRAALKANLASATVGVGNSGRAGLKGKLFGAAVSLPRRVLEKGLKMFVIEDKGGAIAIMLASLFFLGTWPAVLTLLERRGRLPQHTYLDYSITNFLAAILIALTFGQLGENKNGMPSFITQLSQLADQLIVHGLLILNNVNFWVKDNWPSVLFAMAGGVVLSVGNLSTQYAWAYVGLSVTEVISSSMVVVIGTTLNYFLDNRINRAEILFPGVACFLVAVILGSAVHASNAADNEEKLNASTNSYKLG
ncbi:hypothetical protein PR202_gb23649 [Eleusine coracana subsp. coracana]|uniref:Uncharacterized protein n=1 Tax=Eleusine coracana subsp. coracana TaxID=191504 RepID=A0AAV5FJ02_ELECO|nr:hypothetical protein PR202_gb23649 [Eleusine coracana subsp. coracana]